MYTREICCGPGEKIGIFFKYLFNVAFFSIGKGSSNLKEVVFLRVLMDGRVMNVYFCPHLMFNFGYLIEFVCLKIDLIGISYNWVKCKLHPT